MTDKIHRLAKCARCGKQFDHVSDEGKPWSPERALCAKCSDQRSKVGDLLPGLMDEIKKRAGKEPS